jgi:hypothetical protein
MYRLIAIVGASLVLAACSSSDSGQFDNPFESMKFENPFKLEPVKDTVSFESEPAGADAKTTTGQTCRTPCALAIPTDKAVSVTFTLAGYEPATEELQLISMGDGTSKLRPNPVLVQLTPVPPPVKSKTPARRRHVTTKPKPKPKPKPPAQPAAAPPPPMAPAPQPQTTSPWPAAPQPK